MTEEIKQYLDRIASYEEYSTLHESRNEWIYFITDEEYKSNEEYFIIAINKKIDEWFIVFRDTKNCRTVLSKSWL